MSENNKGIHIDTHSFLISVDENNVPSIQVTSEAVSNIYGGDNGKLTAACVAEMALELHHSKLVIEDMSIDEEKNRAKIEKLEDELNDSKSDCEMLRDELDKY